MSTDSAQHRAAILVVVFISTEKKKQAPSPSWTFVSSSSSTEFSFHCSNGRVSKSETSLELLGLAAEVLFLPQHGLTELHRGLLCQLLVQAGTNFFKDFLSSQYGYLAGADSFL